MQQCTIMPCVREILLNLSLPNEGPQGPPNAVMMHPGMTRPPMPGGPPHMAPQMGGPPMGGPPMRPGMINPAMMPQQRMMGIPGQPGPQHQGPQGPQGGPAGSQPPHGYMGWEIYIDLTIGESPTIMNICCLIYSKYLIWESNISQKYSNYLPM